MSPVRRDVIAAVLLSGAAAAIADMRPPGLEETTAFVTAAVQRHHVRLPSRDGDERNWDTAITFAGCAVESRTSLDVRLLGAWQPRSWIARWHLGDAAAQDVHVTTARQGDRATFVVTVRCEDDRACVDRGPAGRDRAASLEFTSDVMARRVAAAFRHASTLCAPAAPK
jgi:hypothetical protein